MNSNAIKTVVAVLIAALALVIGAIALVSTDTKEPEAAITEVKETSVPQVTAEPTTEPEASEQPQEAAEESETGADQTAQNDEAQGTMYEGALAGLTEEEIGAMAMAEEQSHERMDDNTGAEDAVD